MSADPHFERLVRALGRLPTVGRRSADRMAVRLLGHKADLLEPLVEALQIAAKQVQTCTDCGNLTDADHETCSICRDPNRQGAFLCVVQDVLELRLMEQSGGFQGRYFCLGGKVSPRSGQSIDPERLDALVARIRRDGVTEVLLALDSDVESDATAAYVQEMLAGHPVQCSRLAWGLPAGSGVGYSDPVTLARAVRGRQDLAGG